MVRARMGEEEGQCQVSLFLCPLLTSSMQVTTQGREITWGSPSVIPAPPLSNVWLWTTPQECIRMPHTL